MPLSGLLDIAIDSEHAQVTAELVDKIGQILTDEREGGYDVDAVLLRLVLALFRLETAAQKRQEQILHLARDLASLEARVLKAGVALEAP